MKTPFYIRSFISCAVARSTPRWTWVALAGVGVLVSPVGADDWALRFNGSAQYIQAPLGETIQMDDQGPRFVTTPSGTWTVVNATNGFQGRFLQASDPQATARWTPQLPRAGTYKVYTWWGGASAGLDSAAQYVVKSADGLATHVVNQKINAGQWFLLGTLRSPETTRNSSLSGLAEPALLSPTPCGL
jgi:hypothetical protein